jgi:hypothetical protein
LCAYLDRCCRHSNNRPLFVEEFTSEESDIPPAPHHSSAAQQTPRPGWPEELHVQVGCRSKVASIEAGNQRWSKSVVEHGGQEATLDDPGRIDERLRGVECHLNGPLLGIDIHEGPPEGHRCRRKGYSAFHRIPERALTYHGTQPGRLRHSRVLASQGGIYGRVDAPNRWQRIVIGI